MRFADISESAGGATRTGAHATARDLHDLSQDQVAFRHAVIEEIAEWLLGHPGSNRDNSSDAPQPYGQFVDLLVQAAQRSRK